MNKSNFNKAIFVYIPTLHREDWLQSVVKIAKNIQNAITMLFINVIKIYLKVLIYLP